LPPKTLGRYGFDTPGCADSSWLVEARRKEVSRNGVSLKCVHEPLIFLGIVVPFETSLKCLPSDMLSLFVELHMPVVDTRADRGKNPPVLRKGHPLDIPQ